jgi:hypothetical protein
MRKMNVVKIFTVFAFCLCFNVGVSAQNVFSKGDQLVNLGIGVGSYDGTGYATKILPISASYEYGVKDELFDENSALGIGAYIAYRANKQEFIQSGGNFGWDYSHFILGARGILHYQWVEKLDTYAGLMLGYDVASSSSFGTVGNTYAKSVGGFAFSIFGGARYYLADNVSVFGEIGYGIAPLQLGVSFKF